MSKIYLANSRLSDAKIGPLLKKFSNKVNVYPPGTCPLTVQLSLLQASRNQTCGKCVPCRDGLRQLEKMLIRILRGRADMDTLIEMKELAAMKEEYTQIKDAFADVKMKGYGVVSPKKEEIALEEPMIIKQGNKFGVKIHSEAPSIHMIRANIETEIAPIVGTQEQANDLIGFINQADIERGIWDTNIFGKTIEQLVQDGIHGKIGMMGDECQLKLQDTMQRIVNESNGKMICIII